MERRTARTASCSPCAATTPRPTTRPPTASGEYLFLRSDSHAWVEVPFKGSGWITFDPTPPQGSEDSGRLEEFLSSLAAYLDGFSEDAGREFLSSFASLLRLLLPWTLLACLLLWLLGKARGSREVLPAGKTDGDPRMVTLYRDFLRILSRAGIRRRRAETPFELADRARTVLAEGADTADRLTRRFCAARYGGLPVTNAEVDESTEELARLRASVRGHLSREGERP